MKRGNGMINRMKTILKLFLMNFSLILLVGCGNDSTFQTVAPSDMDSDFTGFSDDEDEKESLEDDETETSDTPFGDPIETTTSSYSENLQFQHGDKDGNYVVAGIGDCTDTDIIIPSKHAGRSVVGINSRAFYDCRYITSITIPDSVTSIGEYAFAKCKKLTSITVPDSVTSIGYASFMSCSSLTSITIPDSVTSIGYATFNGCSSLTSITIPSSVTSIGELAFEGCSSLTSVIISNGVISIGDNAFKDCKNITSITIPNSITSIGKNALFDCDSSTNIYYDGTMSEWKNIEKGRAVFNLTHTVTICCTDGQIIYKD